MSVASSLTSVLGSNRRYYFSRASFGGDRDRDCRFSPNAYTYGGAQPVTLFSSEAGPYVIRYLVNTTGGG